MKYKEYDFPDDLLYNKDYSWVRVVGDSAVIGVTDLGAKLVKQFVFVNLPKKGQTLSKGDVYVSLESIKWSGHLKSPVSGRIIDVNKDLIESPEIINQDPYGEGWIVKISLSNKSELNDLMKSSDIIEFLKSKGGV